MANYPNPCDKCPNEPQCKRGCPEWTKRVKTIWKQFNGYSQRACRKELEKAESQERAKDKLHYEHPDIVRRYLQKGPCAGCLCENTCDIPCAAYWRWWDARMQWIRGRLGA